MGLMTFSINVTLDGCVDHQEGIADDETHAFFTRLMDEGGAMLWGRSTYEMMESYWPGVARGDVEAPPAVREWAVKLEIKPKYVVSSTRTDFPWTNSHHIAGDLRSAVQELKDATPAGVLLGSEVRICRTGSAALAATRVRPVTPVASGPRRHASG
jgi:dihydrofolate reductase